MAGRLIVFTGTDKTGKTTISTLLASRLNAPLFRFPDRESPSTGQALNDYLRGRGGLSHKEGQWLMLQNMMEKMGRIKRLLLEGKDVIADRYFVDTQAFCKMLEISYEEISEDFESPPVDHIVLLERTVSPDLLDKKEVFERINTIEALRQIYLEMSQRDDRWKVVQNNGTPEECVDEIIKRLTK